MHPSSAGTDGGRSAARLRLRDFQSALTQRLQAARAAPAAQAALAVHVGALDLLVHLHEVGEILPVGACSRVPRTASWYLGVANLRGRLVGLVDLAQFCGHAPVRLDKDCRLLTFAPALACNAALVVSRLAGLRHPAGLQAAAPPMPGSMPTQVAGPTPWTDPPLQDGAGRVWCPVSLARLVRDERFLHIGAGEA